MVRALPYLIAVGLISRPSALAFSVPHPIMRPDTAQRAQEGEGNTVDREIEAQTDLCPGYPKCDGAYRDKGCDGSGR